MKIFTFIFFLIVFASSNFAQAEKHKWKPLILNEGEKFWYDENSVDSTDGNKFNVWMLQMIKTPLEIDGLDDEIYRSKTLYSVNLDNVKYGILKVVYYNSDNKEIFRHNYDSALVSDELKYTYPILENSPLYAVIKEIFNHQNN